MKGHLSSPGNRCRVAAGQQEGTASGYNTFKRLRGQELGRESFQTVMQFDICEKRREEAALGRARQTTV